MFAKKENSGIIIAGGSRFGCCLAVRLCQTDEEVIIIDINDESFSRLTSDYTGATIEGDASDIEVLRQSGISHAKALIAATDSDNVNLMIAQIARDIYEVPTVIAVVAEPGVLSARDEFDFSILCPALVMTQTVIHDLNAKEG